MDLAVLSGGDFGQCGSVPDTEKIAFIAGCVLLLASVIVQLSLLTRKPVWKIVLTFLIVLGIPALIAGILLFQKIMTLCSIREEAEGVYYMEYAGNYKLDDMLNAGITSDEEMIEWFRKAEFYGIPVTIHTSDIGCSAFKATTTQYISLEKRRISWGLMSITRWESVL